MQTPAFAATKTVSTWELFRGLIWVAAAMAACLCPALAFGQTNSTWNGGSGNWSTAKDWTPNGVPNNGGGNTYNVTIDSGNFSDMVTLDQNVTINSLVLGGFNGESILDAVDILNISSSLIINQTGVLTFTNDATIAGNPLNAGSISFLGGTQTLTGTFTNSAGATFDVGDSNVTDAVTVGMLVNYGFVSIYNGSTLNLTNQPNGIIDVAQNAGVSVSGTFMAGPNNGLGHLTSVEGTLSLANGQTTVVTPTSGTLNMSGLLVLDVIPPLTSVTSLVVNGNLTNSGRIQTGNGNTVLTVSGTFTNEAAGQVVIDDNFTPATLTLNASSFSNAGTISVEDNSTLTLQISNGTNTGTLIAFNGPSPVFGATTLVLSGGTYANTGGIIESGTKGTSVQIDGATVNGGTLKAIFLGATIDLISATINGVALTGQGTFFSSGNTVITGGSNATILQVTNGSALTLAGPFLNTGKIELAAGGKTTQLLISGNVALGGTISMSNNANNVIEGASTGNEVLTNQGTIEGSGNIGNGFMGLINTRTILANQSTPLTIDTSSAGFSNSSGTKNGTLQVNQNDTLNIVGAFNNFSGTTLTGGIYSVAGTLEFTGADIVTNAASITLTGTSSQILDSSNSADALTNSFAVNTTKGSFTLAGNRNFTTPGNFSNAGKITISAGSTLTVGGTNSYKQTAGTTIVSGTLAVTSPGGVDVSGGSVFGIGTITGNIDLTGGLLSAGSASQKAGELTVKGAYAQSGAGAFDVDLGGTAAGTQYDVLDITSTASLGGTLNVDLISGFTPSVGETFDILDYASETGTFTKLNLPKLAGGDTWSISYNATGVVLTVDGPAAAPANPGSVSGVPAKRVSRGLMAGTAADGAREPVAILSRAACFGARMLRASAGCGSERLATVGSGGERRATATAGIGSAVVHNNIMVATRSMSGALSGAGRESSASATAMARLYVCAYFPPSVGHAMGCN